MHTEAPLLISFDGMRSYYEPAILNLKLKTNLQLSAGKSVDFMCKVNAFTLQHFVTITPVLF